MKSLKFIVTAIVVCASSAAAKDVLQLTVGAYDTSIFGDSAADAAINDANSIISKNSDPECDKFEFARSGSPAQFPTDLLADYDNTNASKYAKSGFMVNIVSKILSCGTVEIGASGSFAGCTLIGAFPITVTQLETSMSGGILWLHEIGHAVGLSDICGTGSKADYDAGCLDGAGWVMGGVLYSNNESLSADQCKAYAARVKGVGNITSPLVVDDVSVIDKDTTTPSLKEIIHARWIHRIPFALVASLNSDKDVDSVRQLLAGDDSSYWPNSVLVAGLNGAESDRDLLGSVLGRSVLIPDTTNLDGFAIDAKMKTPLALGYIAKRFESEGAIRQIAPLIDPNANVSFFSQIESKTAAAEYGRALAQNAAIGLAVSCNNELSEGLLNEAKEGVRSGLFDWGVTEDFFPNLDDMCKKAKTTELLKLLSDY